MRVLHLTPEFPPVIWGGLGTAVGGLVTASAKSGITVAVLLVGGVLVIGDGGGYGGGWHPVNFTEKEPQPGSRIDPRGIRFFQVSPQEAVRAGLRFARRWRPDVIHLHSAWLWPAAQAIREQTGVPVVFTVHSLDRAEYEIGQFITLWECQDVVIRSADRLISLSQSEKELLLRYCPEVAGRVRIVGNGIDDVPPRPRRPLDEPPVVLYSGRFVDRKGIRELLAAIPTVLEAAPETRFVLVGGYGGGAEIERCWMDEVLRPWRDRIHFTGWLTPAQVAAWYRVADVLLVPSWYEPFGMVVLEGMLHGLAIVACDVGGPAEILEHGRTALLVPPRNAAALAAAVLRLVENPDLRRSLAAAAAEEVRQRWLWPRIVDTMRAVYAEALQSGLQRRLASPAAA